jgi:hypothetical protein
MGTKRVGWARIRSLINENTNGINVPVRRIENITAAKTLVEADHGKCFTIDADGSAFDITLPANATTGWHCTFLMADVHGSNDIDIVAATADTIEGVIVDASPTNMNAADKLTFVGGTSVLGDQIEIIATDGTTWFARAFSGANGGITSSG